MRILFLAIIVFAGMFQKVVIGQTFKLPTLNSNVPPQIAALIATNDIGNTNLMRAMQYLVAIMAGHAPSKLPDGLTQSNIDYAYFRFFLAPQLNQNSKLFHKQEPFAFYGKVVDENTQAVADANVHFILNTTSSSNGIFDTNTSSAGDGSFSLTGITGSQTSVDVWKTGYYVAKSLNQINFDPTGNGSSKDNPVLFHLRKKGASTDLISSSFNVQMPRDGTPINVDLLNKNFGTSGQMQMSQVKPSYATWKQATAWSFHMVILDGGFIEENDEFPFEAPEGGYQSTIDFNFNAGQPDWKTRFTKSYYIVFGNPPHYGNLTVQTDIMWGGVRISYAVNPDGTQNLEPK
jgi:hypothetical protein